MFLSPETLNFTPTTTALVAVFLVLITTYFIRRDRGLPPGPTGLPYFGYWFFLKKKGSHLQLQELGKKYGDIFCFRVTGHLLINLGSIKALKEFQVLKSDCFATRPSSYVITEHVFGGGVAAASGEQSKILRRFLLNAFKECGLNSNATYHERLNGILEDLGASQGNPVDISAIVIKRSATIMSNAVFGHQGFTEDEVNEFNEDYGKLALALASIKLLLGQIARYTLLPFYSGYHESKLYAEKLFRFVQQKITEHESTYDSNHIRDLIDVYIKERNTREQKGDSTFKYFTDRLVLTELMPVLQ
ncbi:cytochrome P450 2J1-like [Uloborus diversus]|uniref:cytochrome P450 2J1-like n=1 Tax=Uloborus diversus TaxID=327109 RepID=UPI00240A301E|nr:cytochrome P450 2J1-like [Uloborus diversus]